MTAAATPYARRLMLALDAGRCGAADLALAVELAAIIGAELEGFFVEDGELLDLAALPFAREVGGRSGQDRPLVRETTESLLQRRIERTVGELERAGRARHVPVSHTTARGKVVREALLEARGSDVLLFHPRASVPAPEARRTPGPVMLWYEDDDALAASLDIAVELAQRLRAELHVGYPAERFATERDVRAELGAWLARLPGRVRIRPVQGAHTEGLIAAARAARAAQLVLAARGHFATEDALERLLSALGSRVILVR